ncbi:MAG: hypothetical protein Q4F95_09400 [Oscillospiraceae bacterium]|nr:hypothetical protein [Oscillospiraceae bacterium]
MINILSHKKADTTIDVKLEFGEYEYGGSDPEAQIYGYIFSSYDNTPVEVLDKIGFHDIGHTYSDGKREQPEYSTGGYNLHAIINEYYKSDIHIDHTHDF